VSQAFDENVCSILIAPSQGEVENEFCVPLDSHKAPRNTDSLVVLFRLGLVALLLFYEAPDFIALHVLDGDVDDELPHDFLAAPPSQIHSFHDSYSRPRP